MGNMPVQVKTNGLHLEPIPPEISSVAWNAMELRLISLRVPHVTPVALHAGKQRCIHPAVNVPCKLDTVCTVLPGLPSQSELVPLKFKCKMCYKA